MDNNEILLSKYFEKLKLYSFMETYKESIDKKMDHYDLLVKLCASEIKVKDEVARKSMVKTAGFPTIKSLKDFDFTYQPTINQDKVKYLSKLEFIEHGENIILTGSPGVGKTHLAIGIGVESASNRISTYFIKAQKLIASLKLAHDENRLDKRLKQFNRYKLLIIDELGFLPISKLEAKLIFQLIELRYEHRSTIITSNLSVDKWSEIFDDVVIANAITDRILHHSHLFNINGDSYRMRHLLED
ncbi:MAG: IS21-like element helper ATPase IstB [Bacilli bacterium]